MTAAMDIADRLSVLGLGVRAATIDWAISVSREPEDPATTITVFDTGSLDYDTDELDMIERDIQIRVRAQDYDDAASKCTEIIDALKTDTFTAGGKRYMQIRLVSGPMHIGFTEDHDWPLLTMNYTCLIQES